MSWARVHRWLAIVLVVLLAVWSVTGLLFHLKPGWDRAYDQLSAERRGSTLRVDAIVSLGSIRASLGDESITRLELFDTALGSLYRVTTANGTELLDATTARRRSPLDVVDARSLAIDAVARSTHRHDYGDVADVSLGDEVAQVRFVSGPIVEVGRRDAVMSQRGPDTDRIDWLYRIHYLQWTGNRTFDRAFAMLGLALIWAVMIPGIVLFVRRFRA